MHAVLVVPLLAARPAEVWRRRAMGRRFRRRKRFPAHVAVDEARVGVAADSCSRGFSRILAEVLFFAHVFRRRIKRFLKRCSFFRLRAALAAAVPLPDIVARLAARRFPWRTARGRGLRVPFVCSTPGEASCCALPGANGLSLGLRRPSRRLPLRPAALFPRRSSCAVFHYGGRAPWAPPRLQSARGSPHGLCPSFFRVRAAGARGARLSAAFRSERGMLLPSPFLLSRRRVVPATVALTGICGRGRMPFGAPGAENALRAPEFFAADSVFGALVRLFL